MLAVLYLSVFCESSFFSIDVKDVHYEKKYGFEMGREMHAKVITVKPLNSGNLQVFFCPLLKGVRYWEVV